MTKQSILHSDPFRHPNNFVERARSLADSQPEDAAVIVVQERDGELVETRLGYRGFDQRVRALAAVLQRRFEKGERVLIMLDNDEHYAVSMFACFYAGVIAVPAFPPESIRPQHLARLAGIAADAQARGILTASALQALVDGAAAEFEVEQVIAVDLVDPATAGDWQPCEPAAGDVAFLQYTSGSTSAPKGVMVTHGNLMANERAIRSSMGIGGDDRFGVWSPLFHDMGLIGGLLQPFYSGIVCVLSSPRFFLERPLRWLEMISRHRVTISGGPDFAYRLCLDRIKPAQAAGLDLSSWRVAYTGAEPVRQDTMDAFTERYALAGFSAGAIYPCYGLAESTLFLTGGRRGSGMLATRFDGAALARSQVMPDAGGNALVGCGRIAEAHALRIVDARSGEVAAAGTIGEIWAAGESIAAGYWNKPRESADTFVERDGLRWLRTGDLGFVVNDELFVAGRLKDMIIVRGHNLYPQDIERAVEAEVEAVRKGRVAAFSVDLGGHEGIGVAAEVSRGLQKLVAPHILADALSATVSVQCGEAPQVIVLLNPGGLPKTSSGKLQRSACRQGWAARSLDAYAVFENGRLAGADHAEVEAQASLDDTAQALAALWREVLRHDASRRYDGAAHFFSAGGNSLAAVQLAALVAQRWAIDFPPRLVFEHARLQEQADAIRRVLHEGVRAGTPAIPVLPAARRAEPLPLSPAQQRQWVLWRLDPDGTAYHIQGALRIGGALDADAMRQALADLVRRHESLRTVFRVRPDGEVEQLIQAAATLDVQRAFAGDGQAGIVRALHALRSQAFDLTSGPLVRAALLQVSGQEHVLALVMHHIVSDGASMQILVDELAQAYAMRRAGEGAALPPPSIQYADYASWQHGQAGPGQHERQLAYWRAHLDAGAHTAHPVLMLPTDRPRPSVARYRAASQRLELPAERLAQLQALAETHGATLFMVLLAAFQVLLFRHTGQRDIRIGVPVANRARAELQGVVGLFVNTLVLRNTIDSRMTLAQALAGARQAALGALANQDLPFEQLVAALQPERSLTHSPLFQVMFNHLQNDYATFAARTGLAVEELALPDQEAQFELTLQTRTSAAGRIEVNLVYAADLFDPATIERMANHYAALLAALAGNPDRALGDIALLGDAERRQLLEWGAGARATGDTTAVHRLIERQAAAHPHATALIAGATTLTHAQLQSQANRLAHHLIRLGVRPEVKVGIAVERSADMVVGMLAILKAGGAYLPLDPAYPAGRLRHMVDDSGIALLLTQRHLAAQLPAHAGVQVLELDALELDGEPDRAPAVDIHGEHLAYVIYTSGSTGKPKGVAVAHGPLSMHLQAIGAHYGLVAQDRLLQFASISFDAAGEQWMLPLLAGAAVVLPRERHVGLDALTGMLRRDGVTVLYMPPAYLRQLTQTLAPASLPVRLCIAGGEAWATPEFARVRAICVPERVFNAYGPAETVITPTVWSDAGGAGDAAYVPVGRPVGERSALVLDADMNLAPMGAPGELYLGGAGLARGYLARAGLTAERFVADPYQAGGRLYRSGDLVRWNSAGQLEYLGRIDHQVKLRGMRIEPGEIEAELLAQPEVVDAVVAAREGPGGARLVGYVCAVAGQSIDVPSLRERLGRTLPDYMVPTAIVQLDALPLNANGKVDRAALPAPQMAVGIAFAAPQGETEQVLAGIWREVLGVERIGVADNFFDLGGHSLQLIRVHHLLAERLASNLSVVDLFKYPTIGALARRIGQGAACGGESHTADAAPAAAERRRAALLQRKRSGERIN
ncbi:amino acid adenylation domain-containing protein [Massilia atriviolacea]|uniref:Amino acid adenylation domain-containing protein n=1 Tax=Massilia atriviolacea TaxID=2495579 RepID=A0A430HS70_9BURK|nr:non-ribosomal peptide synthetase [Massilia atriviolacea]RSZ60391.1 amino acid adenylation domain-containing protein [Massilia atriviolacea]